MTRACDGVTLAGVVHLSVGQIVENTEAEGPGRRFAVWTQGCSIRCEGCCNPHLFAERGGKPMEVIALLEQISKTAGIEGLTMLGGEPFDQPDALAELCAGVRALDLSVMVFSGFTLEALRSRLAARARAHRHSRRRSLHEGPARDDAPVVGLGEPGAAFSHAARAGLDAGRFGLGNTVEIRLRRGELAINGWPGAKVVQRW